MYFSDEEDDMKQMNPLKAIGSTENLTNRMNLDQDSDTKQSKFILNQMRMSSGDGSSSNRSSDF